MKVTAIGDFQGNCLEIDPQLIPSSDMLLVPGDISNWGDEAELQDFNTWLGKLPHTYKIVVAGNHDQKPVNFKKLLSNAIYLQDEMIEIEGFRIWGSPVNEMNEYRHMKNHTRFCEKSYIKYACDLIPDDLDILLTHGCPYGILDYIDDREGNVGSKDILEVVERTMPRFHVFGHIHEGYGQIEKNGVHYINPAVCDGNNVIHKTKDGGLKNPPIEFEL